MPPVKIQQNVLIACFLPKPEPSIANPDGTGIWFRIPPTGVSVHRDFRKLIRYSDTFSTGSEG